MESFTDLYTAIKRKETCKVEAQLLPVTGEETITFTPSGGLLCITTMQSICEWARTHGKAIIMHSNLMGIRIYFRERKKPLEALK